MTISLNGTSTNYESTRICFNFNFLPNAITNYILEQQKNKYVLYTNRLDIK